MPQPERRPAEAKQSYISVTDLSISSTFFTPDLPADKLKRTFRTTYFSL